MAARYAERCRNGKEMVCRDGFEPPLPEGGGFTVRWIKPLSHPHKGAGYPPAAPSPALIDRRVSNPSSMCLDRHCHPRRAQAGLWLRSTTPRINAAHPAPRLASNHQRRSPLGICSISPAQISRDCRQSQAHGQKEGGTPIRSMPPSLGRKRPRSRGPAPAERRSAQIRSFRKGKHPGADKASARCRRQGAIGRPSPYSECAPCACPRA